MKDIYTTCQKESHRFLIYSHCKNMKGKIVYLDNENAECTRTFILLGINTKRLVPVNYDSCSCKQIKKLTFVNAICDNILDYISKIKNCDAIWFDMECNSIPDKIFEDSRSSLNDNGIISVTLSCRGIEPTKQLLKMKGLYSKYGFKFQGGGPYAGKSGWVNMVHTSAIIRYKNIVKRDYNTYSTRKSINKKTINTGITKKIASKLAAPLVTKQCNTCKHIFKNVATASKLCRNNDCSGHISLIKQNEESSKKKKEKHDLNNYIGKYIYLKDADFYKHNTKNLWKNRDNISLFKITKPYYTGGKYVVHALENTNDGVSLSNKASTWVPDIEYIKLHQVPYS